MAEPRALLLGAGSPGQLLIRSGAQRPGHTAGSVQGPAQQLCPLGYFSSFFKFNPHTVHFPPLKCVIQCVFHVFMKITFRKFSSAQKEALPSLAVTPAPGPGPWHPPSASCSVDWPVLDTSKTWNHTLCDLLCLLPSLRWLF